jgi:hypothetical protein
MMAYGRYGLSGPVVSVVSVFGSVAHWCPWLSSMSDTVTVQYHTVNNWQV